MYLKVCNGNCSNIIFFPEDCIGYPGLFFVTYEFWDFFSIFVKSVVIVLMENILNLSIVIGVMGIFCY